MRLSLRGLSALSATPHTPPLSSSPPRAQVHAYDDARAYLDWSNLTHQAAAPSAAPSAAGAKLAKLSSDP